MLTLSLLTDNNVSPFSDLLRTRAALHLWLYANCCAKGNSEEEHNHGYLSHKAVWERKTTFIFYCTKLLPRISWLAKASCHIKTPKMAQQMIGDCNVQTGGRLKPRGLLLSLGINAQTGSKIWDNGERLCIDRMTKPIYYDHRVRAASPTWPVKQHPWVSDPRWDFFSTDDYRGKLLRLFKPVGLKC